jgi:DNA-binding NtrC family response regulator
MTPTATVLDLAKLRRAASRVSPGMRAKILFVDDEERILNAMRALFRLQYEVVTSTDGYNALELLRQDRFHLIVSDQRMPSMHGIDLLRQAKEVSPNTVRILLTGFSDLAAIVGSINDGEVFRFIIKPWDNQELQSTVAEAVKIGIELANLTAIAGTPFGAAIPSVAPATGEGVIVIDQDPETFLQVKRIPSSSHRAFPAREVTQALEIMQQHEIGVILSSVEGKHTESLEFLKLLKQEHPHVVTIVTAQGGDSEVVINLINQARIFRYLFKPLKPGLLAQYLDSAFVHYRRLKAAPHLLLQHSVQKRSETADPTSFGKALQDRMKSLKSFFARRG